MGWCAYCLPYLLLTVYAQRINRIQSTLMSDLDHVFSSALRISTGVKSEAKITEGEKSKSAADLAECLQTYDMLGLWRDAEDNLRKEVVHEFVKKVCHTYFI